MYSNFCPAPPKKKKEVKKTNENEDIENKDNKNKDNESKEVIERMMKLMESLTNCIKKMEETNNIVA